MTIEEHEQIKYLKRQLNIVKPTLKKMVTEIKQARLHLAQFEDAMQKKEQENNVLYAIIEQQHKQIKELEQQIILHQNEMAPGFSSQSE